MSDWDDLEKLLGLAQAGRRAYGQGKALLERASVEGVSALRDAHWGRDDETTMVLGTFPDATAGTAVLGRLVAIEYVTKKGDDRRPIVYRHEFDTEPESDRPARPERCPLLCFTYDESPSGLVIARANSRYTVTPHGIEH